MNPVISAGDRVRVVIYRNGLHIRSFSATALSYTESGLLRVKEDGTKTNRPYSLANVRKIADKKPEPESQQ